MRVLRDLRRLLPLAAFRRLLGLRLVGQCADGVFQVVLASYLFFSPERQTSPAAIAAVTAAMLLPFSVVGPVAGVLLDRWSRRDVLTAVPALRAVLAVAVGLVVTVGGAGRGEDAALFVLVVVSFAANRFGLSALSAAVPHTVAEADLLPANAVLPTAGTIAFTVGLGLGGLWQGLLGGPGDATGRTLALAVGLWLVTAGLAGRFGRQALGPDRAAFATPPPPTSTIRDFCSGVAHLRERPAAAAAVLLVGAHRMLAGTVLVAAILLFRGPFAAPGDPASGLNGLSLVVLAVGTGIVTAALAVPAAVGRWSLRRTMAALLLGAAALQLAFALTGAEAVLIATTFTLGLSGHGLKIGADTLVQQQVRDDHLGRVFSLYDLVFNVGLVSAAALAALVLPSDGEAPVAMMAVAVALAAVAGLALRALPGTVPARAPVGV